MKKVLAWAVALALVLSSFTMAFADSPKSSADFKDAGDIQYTEAVDVMVATGVINGYPDGTFGPQKPVKRAESAKMIAVMLNGGKDIGDQFKGSCTFADSKDHWAAGYIAYCASTQPVIINGRSADVFDPEGQVTGTEVAKMALCALGYDPAIQGYTGAQWSASVLRDADKVGLFKGLADDFVPGEPCSREATAQILFNALQATMVEYDTTTSVQVGDATVTVNSKVQDQTWPDGTTKELFEDVFDGDLTRDDDDPDDFARPAHSWTYNDEEVGTYADTADYTFFAEDSQTFEKALKAYDSSLADTFFKDGKKKNYVYSAYVNGRQVQRPERANFICLGDKVEMFDLGEKGSNMGQHAGLERYQVVVSHYDAYLIKEATTDLSKKEIEAEHTAKVTFNGVPEPVYDDELPGFNVDTYVADAVIAIAVGRNEVLDSYVMDELAKGEVTEFEGTANAPTSISIDGTAYDPTDRFRLLDGKAIEAEKEFTLYDYNGFAAGSVKTDESVDVYYGILTKYSTPKPDDYGDIPAQTVKIVTSEGDETPFTLIDSKDRPAGFYLPESRDECPVLVSYELDEDGLISMMSKADTASTSWTGKAIKNNRIYGQVVADEIVAFYKDKDDNWNVYDKDALEDADRVNIAQYFKTDDGLVALYLSDSLVAPEEVLGLVESVTPINNGAKYKIGVFVDGADKAKYYTFDAADVCAQVTEEQPNPEPKFVDIWSNKGDPTLLAKITLEGKDATAIDVANTYGVKEAGKDFPDGVDAEWYVGFNGNNHPCTSMFNHLLAVIDKDGHYLDVGYLADEDEGYDGYSDPQLCEDDEGNLASVYYVNDEGKLVSGSFSDIEKESSQWYSRVILLNTIDGSDGWNIVIYVDGDSKIQKLTSEPTFVTGG